MRHASGLVHWDVKPDNTIPADGNPGRPVLLDCGLNFHRAAKKDLEENREGNCATVSCVYRNSRRAALSNKIPHSDISFAAGILCFLLTSQHPHVLQDAEGRLQHQRSEALGVLKCVSSSILNRLLAFFGRAFAPQIADRFMAADSMLVELGMVMEPPQESTRRPFYRT